MGVFLPRGVRIERGLQDGKQPFVNRPSSRRQKEGLGRWAAEQTGRENGVRYDTFIVRRESALRKQPIAPKADEDKELITSLPYQ